MLLPEKIENRTKRIFVKTLQIKRRTQPHRERVHDELLTNFPKQRHFLVPTPPKTQMFGCPSEKAIHILKVA